MFIKYFNIITLNNSAELCKASPFNGLVKIFLSYSKYIDVLLTLPPS